MPKRARVLGRPSVTLRDITARTVRTICDLTVRPDQRRFVAPNAVSIAQAYFDRSAAFRAVYADEEPIGFVMWRPASEPGTCFVWRLMIDHRHQTMGFGRKALQLLSRQCAEAGSSKMSLSCVPAAGGPLSFYERFGFVSTGRTLDNGEQVLEMSIGR